MKSRRTNVCVSDCVLFFPRAHYPLSPCKSIMVTYSIGALRVPMHHSAINANIICIFNS